MRDSIKKTTVYTTTDGKEFDSLVNATKHQEQIVCRKLEIKYFIVRYRIDDFSGIYASHAIAAVLAPNHHENILSSFMKNELGSSETKLADNKIYPTYEIEFAQPSDFIKHEYKAKAFSGWGAGYPGKIFLAPVMLPSDDVREIQYKNYFDLKL